MQSFDRIILKAVHAYSKIDNFSKDYRFGRLVMFKNRSFFKFYLEVHSPTLSYEIPPSYLITYLTSLPNIKS